MAKTKKSAARKQADASAEPVATQPSLTAEPPPQPNSGASEAEGGGLSFEGALERLEETVGRLEEGEMPLEEALTLFEQGVKLSRQCTTTLEAAEKRVEILVAGRGDDWLVAPFDSEGGSDEEDEDFD